MVHDHCETDLNQREMVLNGSEMLQTVVQYLFATVYGFSRCFGFMVCRYAVLRFALFRFGVIQILTFSIFHLLNFSVWEGASVLRFTVLRFAVCGVSNCQLFKFSFREGLRFYSSRHCGLRFFKSSTSQIVNFSNPQLLCLQCLQQGTGAIAEHPAVRPKKYKHTKKAGNE
ncbi:hypothetical protein DMA11_11340 [Marinilabiliaceae bacterium JC017]|nr:hypothetical protein DMA11_11340 [Marinilabiliaceae bacterium JC017]